MQKDYNVLPGGYSAGMYVAGQCVEAAIQALGGQSDDRKALAEALHKVSIADTPRGAVKFDQYGNVVGDVFIRRCEKKGDQLVNTVIKTYPEREPVLDLPGEGLPRQPGLFPRLPAGQEPGELKLSMRRHPVVAARHLSVEQRLTREWLHGWLADWCCRAHRDASRCAR